MSSNETTDSDSRSNAPGSMLVWALASSALHLLLWFVVLAYFCFYVPRQKNVFEDFGVALPQAAILVIQLSDLILVYWYLVLPALFVTVVGMNAVLVAVVRSRGWRLALIGLLAILPIGWLASCHLILQVPFDRLMQELQ